MGSLKGGLQSKRAAMLCDNHRFGLYLDQRRREKHELAHEALPDGTHTPADCADWVRAACGVSSRAEIDHFSRASKMLARIITDYQRWERQRAARQQSARNTV